MSKQPKTQTKNTENQVAFKVPTIIGIKATKQMKALFALGSVRTRRALKMQLKAMVDNEFNKRNRKSNKDIMTASAE